MVQPSPSYTVALHLEVPASQKAVARLVNTATATGAVVTGVDVAEAGGDTLTVDLTADTRDSKHRGELVARLEEIEGVVVRNVGDSTFLAHVGGKIEVVGTYPIHNRRDLARVYTPGVARVCKAIYDHPERARMLTIKKNTVAVVTDGTAVLGMGDIGPAAAMPVMEGKAVLFKQFGNVDAWPVALDTKDPEEIIAICKAIAPAYGGINLEDIAAPKCFDIEARLREELDIPVFHDDQHGTAIVTLAALINALRIVDKRIEDVRIVLSGVGAAGSAIAKLLMAHGATDIVGYGRDGALSAKDTEGMNEHRKWLAENTNPRQVTGTLKEGLAGADVFIGVSSGNLLEPGDLEVMNEGAIVFAMANPTPEVDPIGAADYATVVATGRSDFPNQINNVLAFPGLFRGLLDTGITEITTELLRAAATGIASVIDEKDLSPVYIIPGAFDTRVAKAVAGAVRKLADRQGLAIP
ncbi:NAD-dependent malic enzyme [Actinomyces slackii]|uniref:NADP-dependent malic enzyme n=1 Tax=Actinomyces slackii TaxID=52774 RepID=A0A3S4STF8_9ACTO|nr:NAD-dependent malic enzyme [Actinomyces slackii]VEG74663.1 NADP-dependent malic enzyme [Actinomyces slackii]